MGVKDLESAPSGSPHSRMLDDHERERLLRTGSGSSSELLLEKRHSQSVRRGGQQALSTLVHSWFSRKFAVGCAILFPVVVTVYVTWWFLTFFDNFFSPIYYKLFHFHVFGLGAITSMAFIFFTGVFFSSWLGGWMLGLGEVLITRMPLIKHIYSASKQVSAALNPENEAAKAFQECVIIKHPRHGEYAFAFITGRTVLQTSSGTDMRLYTVYVPTNHVYVGDIFLLSEEDVIHTNLSVREGLEVVISCGMAIPPTLVAQAAASSSSTPQRH